MGRPYTMGIPSILRWLREPGRLCPGDPHSHHLGAGTSGGRPSNIRTTMSSPCLYGRVLQARPPRDPGDPGHLQDSPGTMALPQIRGRFKQTDPHRLTSPSAAHGMHVKGTSDIPSAQLLSG